MGPKKDQAWPSSNFVTDRYLLNIFLKVEEKVDACDFKRIWCTADLMDGSRGARLAVLEQTGLEKQESLLAFLKRHASGVNSCRRERHFYCTLNDS